MSVSQHESELFRRQLPLNLHCQVHHLVATQGQMRCYLPCVSIHQVYTLYVHVYVCLMDLGPQAMYCMHAIH